MAFKKIPLLSTDPVLEKNGVRTEISINIPATADKPAEVLEAWVLVRRAGGNNLLFGQAAEAIRKPFKYQYDHDAVPEELKAQHNLFLYADACVADFGGFPGEDKEDGSVGDMIPFSRENARELLQAYSTVFDIVRETANKSATYRLAEHSDAVEQAKKG